MTPVPPTPLATVLVVAALAAWLFELAPGEPPRVAAIACEHAVLVDDELKCDGEAPSTLAELCGGEDGAADGAIEAGDRIDRARVCAGDSAGHARMSTVDLRALAIPIDINSAPLEELRSLPGIGPTLGQRIVDARPYASVDELDRVRGIGPKTIERLRARLRFESATHGVGWGRRR